MRARGPWGTFDQVEFARRRVAELVRASDSIAGREDVVKRIERTASHCWCFWIAPRPDLPALLISGDWNLSAFVLLGLFSRVEVWETDAHRAAVLESVAAEAEANLEVHHCPPALIADRLRLLGGPYGLAAMQDALGPVPQSRATRREMLRDLAAVTKGSGQCCVVGRNRFSLTNRSRFLRNGLALPTPAELSRAWTYGNHGHAEIIFLHPDHQAPTELLFPPVLLPQARRNRLSMRLLERIGVIERVLGSFASFFPSRRGALLIDQSSSQWQRNRAAVGSAHWCQCVVKENAMMFVTVVLGEDGEAILRIPLLREAAEALVRLDAVYAEVARTLPAVSRLIPESLPLFGVCGWPMHMERRCRGVPARAVLSRADARSKIRAQIADFVNLMCTTTASRSQTPGEYRDAHLDAKVRSIGAVEASLASDLASVGSAADSLMPDSPMPTIRIHGDLNVNNVFVDPASCELTGVIDWETSLTGSPPYDLIHYLIAERRELDPQPWGVLVARAIAGELFDAEARELLRNHLEALELGAESLRPLLVAYWLRGVHLRQVLSGGRLEPRWRELNLVGPLGSIKRLLTAGP